MKCNKCKKEFSKGTNYCNYCGNKINLGKIIILNIVNVFLYIVSSILLIFTLVAWFDDKVFIEGLFLFISTIFTCPLTYRFVLNVKDKIYIRVIVIVFSFIIGVSISPTKENTVSDLKDDLQVASVETEETVEAKDEEQQKKEQEALEEQKRQEELKAKQEEKKKTS